MKTKVDPAPKAPNLLSWYLTDGSNLFWVVAHSKHNITLENCYSNLQTCYSYSEFVKLGLRKVTRRGSNEAKEPVV